MNTPKFNLEKIKESLPHQNWDIGTLQTVLYVAVGGGVLGQTFAERPENAYIDSRIGRLPYRRKDIEQIRLTLIELAKAKGLNPKKLPKRPEFHNCGVF